VLLPVGRVQASQMRGLAAIADRFGSGTIRLTVWQNLLISDIAEKNIPEVKKEIEALGLQWQATGIRAGLIACTGNAGCKYAAANTKLNAMQVAEYLEARIQLDRPINIHLTGCHNSCAQHFIGDIGLIGAKVVVGDDEFEGYHIFIGGGYGAQQGIGREMFRDVQATHIGPVLESMLKAYLENRASGEETFHDFVKRQTTEQLRELFNQHTVKA
jgi:ferredoxin-nitrite reductase